MVSSFVEAKRETTGSAGEEVAAVVVVRSASGLSLLGRRTDRRPETIHALRPEPHILEAARHEMDELGFSVSTTGTLSVSISGPRETFEELFRTDLIRETREALPGAEVPYFTALDSESGRLLRLPDELSHLSPLIEGVVLAKPMVFTECALPPLAPVHPQAYRYLFVPHEVATVLGAARAHREGISGRGLRVAMPDSGFFKHPYYGCHGYGVDAVVPIPGEYFPDRDEVGHGTGIAANLFAVAPDVELVPIKALSNPVAGFEEAKSQGVRVITCSWKTDCDDPGASFDEYMSLLHDHIDEAVAQSIVVCCAAGNGERNFPAGHPDVIAVGGVHVHHPDLALRASDHASSFDSSLYSGRHVPDLCGLVGMSVAGRSPLLMLPIPANSTVDKCFSAMGVNGAPGDGTEPDDGWSVISGTSSACPQVAGAAALLLQLDPTLSPAQVKEILVGTATDVEVGNSNPATGGDLAEKGWDRATGAGLVDVDRACSLLVSQGHSALR